MIHWTLLPHELIFQPESPFDTSIQEVTVNGVKMQVSLKDPQNPTIVRLLSMNPDDFLDPRFQPGNQVRLEE